MLNFAAAERAVLQYLNLTDWFSCRILDNAHLLDATEIFRKLNVHKKVWNSVWDVLHSGSLKGMELIYPRTGIIHQARLPLGHVLLLSLFDDRGLNSR